VFFRVGCGHSMFADPSSDQLPLLLAGEPQEVNKEEDGEKEEANTQPFAAAAAAAVCPSPPLGRWSQHTHAGRQSDWTTNLTTTTTATRHQWWPRQFNKGCRNWRRAAEAERGGRGRQQRALASIGRRWQQSLWPRRW